MQLTTHPIEAILLRSGHQSEIAVAVGQSLKIETTPNGIEVLNTECPTGKQWSVRIIVEITETDT